MSRTVKGSKGPGFEYHRKPAGGYWPVGRWWKRHAHKVARMSDSEALRHDFEMVARDFAAALETVKRDLP